MSGKRAAFIAAVITVLSLLSGCSDYRELEEMLIVVAAAVDCEKPGEMVLTAEMLRAEGAAAGSSDGTSTYTARAESMAGCEQELRRIAGGELYWGHAEAIVFSGDAIEQYLYPVLDWALRDNEARLTVALALSSEETAAELFAANESATSAGDAIHDLLIAGSYADAEKRSAAVRVKDRLDGGEYALLPIIGVTESADYRKGSGGSSDSSGASEQQGQSQGQDQNMGGMNGGSGDSGSSGGEEQKSSASVEPRMKVEGAAVVLGSPVRVAGELTEDDMQLLRLSEGECGRDGYVIEGEDWTLIVESAKVDELNGSITLSGNCRVALMDVYESEEDAGTDGGVDAVTYGEVAVERMEQEASQLLEAQLGALLEKFARINGEEPLEVEVSLKIVNIGLISAG